MNNLTQQDRLVLLDFICNLHKFEETLESFPLIYEILSLNGWPFSKETQIDKIKSFLKIRLLNNEKK